MEPGGGAHVRDIDYDFVANLFDTHCALEAMLSRAAAQYCTELELGKLQLIEF